MSSTIVVRRPRAPKVSVHRLLDVARRALPAAVAEHDVPEWLTLRGIFVAVDAGYSPGSELAALVTAAHEGLPESEARRRVEKRLQRRRETGISFIFTAFVDIDVLFSVLRLPAARNSLRRWLATPASPRQHRLVALSGSRLAMELASPPRDDA